MTPAIRVARVDDIPAALELCRISGWNQRREDWARLLEHEPAGCFVAEAEGQVVGTVTTTRYGNRLAWIGMMLVHPDYRRQGIATALMSRSLQYLQDHNVLCVKLDATPEGQPVYQRLGFHAEWTMQRWLRAGSEEVPKAPTERRSCPLDPSLLSTYLDLDLRAFGVDRHDWILRLLSDSQVRCRPAALGMLRPGFLAGYLGPIIASDAADGRLVVEDLIASSTQPLFWDIPDPNLAAVQIARELQFQPIRHLTRMWMGSQRIDSDLRLLFALADPSTG